VGFECSAPNPINLAAVFEAFFGVPRSDTVLSNQSDIPNLRSFIEKPLYAVIWTTTPWTIPANQALNVHPDH
jgi:isoleucyl-tRNA synthetase